MEDLQVYQLLRDNRPRRIMLIAPEFLVEHQKERDRLFNTSRLAVHIDTDRIDPLLRRRHDYRMGVWLFG